MAVAGGGQPALCAAAAAVAAPVVRPGEGALAALQGGQARALASPLGHRVRGPPCQGTSQPCSPGQFCWWCWLYSHEIGVGNSAAQGLLFYSCMDCRTWFFFALCLAPPPGNSVLRPGCVAACKHLPSADACTTSPGAPAVLRGWMVGPMVRESEGDCGGRKLGSSQADTLLVTQSGQDTCIALV